MCEGVQPHIISYHAPLVYSVSAVANIGDRTPLFHAETWTFATPEADNVS
jgi:hypothetical protein